MKFLGTLLILIACLVCIASSTPVRLKRQWGYPNYGGGMYPNYGGGFYPNYGGGWYGPRPYWRRPTVVEKTVIYRPG
ncbi:hypothetical protein ANCCAN_05538 [Ancylostoma caninum]|uniref:Sulfur globule protein CV3 domain protein n=1 Tax=Ancylostoma caninum TaxID=29170 RepID=A0A368GZG5_ANCCA|nr:hypothetical protein ANCCAN_05538 [Ancylostoma caninum]